jgi:hypothetical protein
MVAASAYFGMSGWMTTVILFALSLLAGYVSYTFIEQPCRTLLKGTPGARGYTHARPMARLVCAPLPVIAAAAVTMVYHGIPQRNEAVAPIYRPSLAAEADNRFPYKCDGTGTFGTTVRQCVPGSASNHDDVLVIGDSFAQMWYAHITELEPKLFDHAVVRDHAHMRSSYTASAGNFLDRFIEQQIPTAGVSVGMMNFGPIRP